MTAYAAEPYIGQFLFKYEGDSVYRMIVSDSNSLSWACIQGPEKGANGIEKPERFKVADNIYFVSWVEKTGINVSQVINLNTRKVHATIIDGKQRYVISGDIVREK
ncbi:MAG: MoaF C-terminal domain-containing protein [Methylophilus sp.]|uniref:phenolic acid decarboxylase n=1 Tax=Methylophilus sp. TaxID=29541 RepID=UPI002C36ECBD|nr:MoaF C-terminal domain-containing protein [Methylophilus sp.]HSH85660.1 MoaF C-terminal domain-containing protein [Methylophilus sp.]